MRKEPLIKDNFISTRRYTNAWIAGEYLIIEYDKKYLKLLVEDFIEVAEWLLERQRRTKEEKNEVVLKVYDSAAGQAV